MSSAPQQSRYAMGSASNMVRSLLVILGLVVVLILMVPRVNTLSAPKVDVHAKALSVQRSTGWPIVEAVGLPQGWTPQSATYLRSTDSVMVWHAGYQAPSGRFVAVEQAADPTSRWLRAQTNRAPKLGTVEAGGRTWDRIERVGKTQNTLLLRPVPGERLTTLVTGTADFDELTALIEHLRPVTR